MAAGLLSRHGDGAETKNYRCKDPHLAHSCPPGFLLVCGKHLDWLAGSFDAATSLHRSELGPPTRVIIAKANGEPLSRGGLDGLADAPRSGKPAHYETEHEPRILAVSVERPPAGHRRWDGGPAGLAFGRHLQASDLAPLRRHKISLARHCN
jgi:hypothetical protein